MLQVPRRYGKTSQAIKKLLELGELDEMVETISPRDTYRNLGYEHGKIDKKENNEYGHSAPIHIVLPEFKDAYWAGYDSGFKEVDDVT